LRAASEKRESDIKNAHSILQKMAYAFNDPTIEKISSLNDYFKDMKEIRTKPFYFKFLELYETKMGKNFFFLC